MIAQAMVKEVERLLAEGRLSQRKIARTIGISRASVGAIAAGKRPDYESRQREREAEEEPQGPLERCAGCGGMVFTPCRLCRVRKIKELTQQARREVRRRQREQTQRRLLAALHRAVQRRDREQEQARPRDPIIEVLFGERGAAARKRAG